jgi:hypothetical protein
VDKQTKLLKKLRKSIEPSILRFLNDKGFIQKGQKIEFEWGADYGSL